MKENSSNFSTQPERNFNDITRSDPSGTQITFKECKSSMFRSRKLLQYKIPASACEFCQQLPETSFTLHIKATITLENRIAMIFFSDHIYEFVNNINSIYFDGTFQTVPMKHKNNEERQKKM